MIVQPLNTEETRWVHKLDKLMAQMMKRLLLLECADVLMVLDREAALALEDMSDGNAERAGVVLGVVPSATMKITSVSG